MRYSRYGTVQETVRKNKEEVYKAFNNECKYCGETDISLLEFHHVDPTTKKYNIAKIWHWTSMLWKELEKCVLLCKSCHRGDALHGTRSKYNKGCRCRPCREANADYEYKRRTGLERK